MIYYSWNDVSLPTLPFFFFEIGISAFVMFSPSHHLEPEKVGEKPSMFGPGEPDAEDSDDTRATALPGPFSLTWMFPKIGVPQNGWFIMENPTKRI